MQAVVSELAQQILNLQQGDHLCLFYEKNPAEQMPALIPFIQNGLSQDEQFIYIADDQTVEDLEARLQQSGINVGKESDRGALKLWTRREWRQPGELSSEKKSRQVLEFISEASKSGFKGSRFAVEMTWTLGPDIGADLLEHWEATLNTIFVPGFPGRIACQYNQSRLSPEVMLAALHTHPLAILGDHVYPNFFYEAPLILQDGANTSAARLNWMISQLKRARVAEREKAKLEGQLRQAQKMESIGTLAGGVAHDFNNILNIIKSYASMIGRLRSNDRQITENLKVIDEAVDRGSSLARQLLTIARKTEAHLLPTNVNDAISELSKLLKQTFPKTIDLFLELDPKLPPVMADSNQISQALLNLCLNARDAMPAGGTITLRTKLVDTTKIPDGYILTRTEPWICAEVVDTGSGMDATVQSRIFEPFFTTKGIGQGTGLGLSIVYGIVKNHNGFIDVESQEGRGTTFRLCLPIASAEQTATTADAPTKESADLNQTNGVEQTVL